MKLRFALALLCVGVVSAAGRAQVGAPAEKGTIKYLARLQQKNGGFLGAAAAPEPTLRATTSAVRALKLLGSGAPDKAACVKFVASCYDPASGGFVDVPGKGKPDVLSTAVGLMAVAALGMPAEPYHAAATKFLAEHAKSFEEVRVAAAALESIRAKSPKAAAWLAVVEEEGKKKIDDPGRARALASIVMTRLRLGGELLHADQLKKVLQEGQLASGGYDKPGAERADLESSYRVMRGLMMLKALPEEVEGMRSFVAKCQDNDDYGYGVEPGTPSTVAGTYYAITILHWLRQGERKKN